MFYDHIIYLLYFKNNGNVSFQGVYKVIFTHLRPVICTRDTFTNIQRVWATKKRDNKFQAWITEIKTREGLGSKANNKTKGKIGIERCEDR